MRLCSHCGGDGYLVYLGGPGYFSPSFGNWLPGEREERCSFCVGTGLAEVEGAEEVEVLQG